MTRVIGIDPGSVSIDFCGLEDGRLWLDSSMPTAEALEDPSRVVELLRSGAEPDLIAGPSGYGLPLIRAADITEESLRLAFLAAEGETGGIGGLRRLARHLAGSGLSIVFTPGVIHLQTVPAYRKINRVDLGTAEKVAVAALGIVDQCKRIGCAPEESSFILLELGGAFTAALAVSGGSIVDGIGGTSGPIGWRSGGAWDGEVAFLAGEVTKAMLFEGGVGELVERDEVGNPTQPPSARGISTSDAIAAYSEGALKAVHSLTVALPTPREILLSGRYARREAVRGPLEARLARIAPARQLEGFAKVAKQGAQGAAIIADGLAGGTHARVVETLGIGESGGTALDFLQVIPASAARRRLGLG